MRILRWSVVTCLLVLVGEAHPVLTFSNRKTSTQVGEQLLQYEGGSFSMGLRDGAVELALCGPHPSHQQIFPDPACPLGSNAYTMDNGLQWWSVASLQAATGIEPFGIDRVRLPILPPGEIRKLLQANSGDPAAVFAVDDRSQTIYYDPLTSFPPFAFPFPLYETTDFRLERAYGAGEEERRRQHREFPSAVYGVHLPLLGDPGRLELMTHTLLSSLEIYPGSRPTPGGLRLSNNNWAQSGLQWDALTEAEIAWIGEERLPPFDRFVFSIRANQWVGLDGVEQITRRLPEPSEVQLDGDGQPLLKEDVVVFPGAPVTTPDGVVYEVIPFAVEESARAPFEIDILSGAFAIPAATFAEGMTGMGVLELRREIVQMVVLSTGPGIVREESSRTLQVAVDFVDGNDTDGDGMSNQFEELHGLDPQNPDEDGNGVFDGIDDLDGDELTGAEEESVGSSPLLPDSDLDGLPDAAEVRLTNTNPVEPDSDGDGISDAGEDTDGDGFTHLEEVLLHLTDPLDARSVFVLQLVIEAEQAVLSFPTRSGRTYSLEASDNGITWQVRRTISGEDGDHLEELGPLHGVRGFFRVRVALNP